MAENDHGERVADQKQVDAGFVHKAGTGVVVGGERGDGLALALHFTEAGMVTLSGRGEAGETLSAGEAGDAHSCLQCRSGNSGCDPNKASVRLGAG